MNEVEINRVSYACPKLGMISAPAGTLILITSAVMPGGRLHVACACGEEHRIKMGESTRV